MLGVSFSPASNVQVMSRLALAAVYLPCSLNVFEVMLTGKSRWQSTTEMNNSFGPIVVFGALTTVALFFLWMTTNNKEDERRAGRR